MIMIYFALNRSLHEFEIFLGLIEKIRRLPIRRFRGLQSSLFDMARTESLAGRTEARA